MSKYRMIKRNSSKYSLVPIVGRNYLVKSRGILKGDSFKLLELGKCPLLILVSLSRSQEDVSQGATGEAFGFFPERMQLEARTRHGVLMLCLRRWITFWEQTPTVKLGHTLEALRVHSCTSPY